MRLNQLLGLTEHLTHGHPKQGKDEGFENAEDISGKLGDFDAKGIVTTTISPCAMSLSLTQRSMIECFFVELNDRSGHQLQDIFHRHHAGSELNR